ncbi:hypothetical protein LCGC14_2695110, partial [marine sediment metagenome]
MATSVKHKGWKLPVDQDYLMGMFNGTEVFRITASEFTVAQASAFTGNMSITGDVTLTGDVEHTGDQTYTGTVNHGAEAAGQRVNFYGDTAGARMVWADDDNWLYFIGIAGINSVGSGPLNWTGAASLGSLNVLATCTVQGGLSTASSLTVIGAGSFQASVGIVGSLTCNSHVIIGGNIEQTGNLRTVGSAQLDSTLSVGGVLTVLDATTYTSTTTGAVIIGGGLGVAENINMGGDLFLATGKKIDFNAGEITMTHSSITSGGKIKVNTAWATDTTVGRPFEVYLTLSSDTRLGSYANAFKAMVDCEEGAVNGAGSTGLLSAGNFEMGMPNKPCWGAYYCLEMEYVDQASTTFGAPGT